ncbi:MAG: hypothetical protein ACI841_005408, partial [Planctomycetota bacterium]
MLSNSSVQVSAGTPLARQIGPAAGAYLTDTDLVAMSEPSTRVAPSKLGLVILSIVAVLGGLHAFSFLGAGPFDDDFIVHRYARMWVQGEGLAFNPGEHVEGFTVPLWLFLSAGVQLLGLDPVAASQWVSIVAAGV